MLDPVTTIFLTSLVANGLYRATGAASHILGYQGKNISNSKGMRFCTKTNHYAEAMLATTIGIEFITKCVNYFLKGGKSDSCEIVRLLQESNLKLNKIDDQLNEFQKEVMTSLSELKKMHQEFKANDFNLQLTNYEIVFKKFSEKGYDPIDVKECLHKLNEIYSNIEFCAIPRNSAIKCYNKLKELFVCDFNSRYFRIIFPQFLKEEQYDESEVEIYIDKLTEAYFQHASCNDKVDILKIYALLLLIFWDIRLRYEYQFSKKDVDLSSDLSKKSNHISLVIKHYFLRELFYEQTISHYSDMFRLLQKITFYYLALKKDAFSFQLDQELILPVKTTIEKLFRLIQTYDDSIPQIKYVFSSLVLSDITNNYWQDIFLFSNVEINDYKLIEATDCNFFGIIKKDIKGPAIYYIKQNEKHTCWLVTKENFISNEYEAPLALQLKKNDNFSLIVDLIKSSDCHYIPYTPHGEKERKIGTVYICQENNQWYFLKKFSKEKNILLFSSDVANEFNLNFLRRNWGFFKNDSTKKIILDTISEELEDDFLICLSKAYYYENCHKIMEAFDYYRRSLSCVNRLKGENEYICHELVELLYCSFFNLLISHFDKKEIRNIQQEREIALLNNSMKNKLLSKFDNFISILEDLKNFQYSFDLNESNLPFYKKIFEYREYKIYALKAYFFILKASAYTDKQDLYLLAKELQRKSSIGNYNYLFLETQKLIVEYAKKLGNESEIKKESKVLLRHYFLTGFKVVLSQLFEAGEGDFSENLLNTNRVFDPIFQLYMYELQCMAQLRQHITLLKSSKKLFDAYLAVLGPMPKSREFYTKDQLITIFDNVKKHLNIYLPMDALSKMKDEEMKSQLSNCVAQQYHSAVDEKNKQFENDFCFSEVEDSDRNLEINDVCIQERIIMEYLLDKFSIVKLYEKKWFGDKVKSDNVESFVKNERQFFDEFKKGFIEAFIRTFFHEMRRLAGNFWSDLFKNENLPNTRLENSPYSKLFCAMTKPYHDVCFRGFRHNKFLNFYERLNFSEIAELTKFFMEDRRFNNLMLEQYIKKIENFYAKKKKIKNDWRHILVVKQMMFVNQLYYKIDRLLHPSANIVLDIDFLDQDALFKKTYFSIISMGNNSISDDCFKKYNIFLYRNTKSNNRWHYIFIASKSRFEGALANLTKEIVESAEKEKNISKDSRSDIPLKKNIMLAIINRHLFLGREKLLSRKSFYEHTFRFLNELIGYGYEYEKDLIEEDKKSIIEIKKGELILSLKTVCRSVSMKNVSWYEKEANDFLDSLYSFFEMDSEMKVYIERSEKSDVNNVIAKIAASIGNGVSQKHSDQIIRNNIMGHISEYEERRVYWKKPTWKRSKLYQLCVQCHKTKYLKNLFDENFVNLGLRWSFLISEKNILNDALIYSANHSKSEDDIYYLFKNSLKVIQTIMRIGGDFFLEKDSSNHNFLKYIEENIIKKTELDDFFRADIVQTVLINMPFYLQQVYLNSNFSFAIFEDTNTLLIALNRLGDYLNRIGTKLLLRKKYRLEEPSETDMIKNIMDYMRHLLQAIVDGDLDALLKLRNITNPPSFKGPFTLFFGVPAEPSYLNQTINRQLRTLSNNTHYGKISNISVFSKESMKFLSNERKLLEEKRQKCCGYERIASPWYQHISFFETDDNSEPAPPSSSP